MRRWLADAETVLGNHSDRLNAINIFPVADGDTGTNLYHTVRAAATAAADAEGTDVGEVLAAAGQAAMEEAWGNSGTLFAVFLDAFAASLRGHARVSGPLLAAALHRAQIRAWSALSEPVAGTMLSVLEAAADGAARARHDDAPEAGADSNQALAATLDAAVEAAVGAVVDTEAQLGVLARAHVVDAGGVGFLLVLGALRNAVLGNGLGEDVLEGLHGYRIDDPHIHGAQPAAEGVEVMCTLTLTPLDAAGLRQKLDEIGDSVIMSPVGAFDDGAGECRWRVHVHVPDPEAALTLIGTFGTPERIAFTELHAADPTDAGVGDGSTRAV
ncbi:DAK2 domain-containing protein [Sinomonas halotolerans]|uniref:DAK2 domain-containing protein n=1 Tax=Sinomonas halotolerans TaxID=1644133 RepID=A0ABU9X135_9MICC